MHKLGSKHRCVSESTNMAVLRQSSPGGMLKRTGKYSLGIGFRHHVTMLKALLIGLSSRCVSVATPHRCAALTCGIYKQWNAEPCHALPISHPSIDELMRLAMQAPFEMSQSGIDLRLSHVRQTQNKLAWG